MKKNINIIKIINIIIQKQQQQKIMCSLNITNKQQINLLNFLWINKLIYGFTNKKNNAILFLKVKKTESHSSFTKIDKFFNKNSIYKLKRWSPNNFFIINNNKFFLNIRQIHLSKIGGYISYKIS